MSGRLEGTVAIVTGAARGTGEQIARELVLQGARVVLGDVLDEPGRAVAKDLGNAARYAHLDVTREEDWDAAVALAGRELGAPNALVNNAAVLQVAAIEETTREDFERVVAVNQLGPFLGIRALIESMRAAGGGSIVNIGSIDGLIGQNGVVAYAASKWGLRGLARCAALELGRYGIRVNTVCPASGSMDMILPFIPRDLDADEARAIAARQPRRALIHEKPKSRVERLREIARLVAYLLSDDATTITGADFPIDAGHTAGVIVPGAPGE